MITHTNHPDYKQSLSAYKIEVLNQIKYDGPKDWMHHLLDDIGEALTDIRVDFLFDDIQCPCFYYDDMKTVTTLTDKMVIDFNQNYNKCTEEI